MDAPDPEKPYAYIAYIDEAGDFGLRNVVPVDQRGASEWLIISAAVIRQSIEPQIVDGLRQLRLAAKNTQSPALHFRTLNDRQKKIICAGLAKMDVRLFVVISNKQNMRYYKNRFAASVSSTGAWFYWWMCRLLFERVSEFCEHRNDLAKTPGAKIRFEFSRRTDLDYSEFTGYLSRIWAQEQPFLKKRIPRWSVIDLQQIHALDHRTRAGLQLADIVASAFYRAVNRDGVAAPNAVYAEALKPRIWSKNGDWFEEGVKVFPYPLRFPKLDDSQKRIFRFYGYPPDKW
jgi:hypothetical protein